jgi:hypothetical protein
VRVAERMNMARSERAEEWREIMVLSALEGADPMGDRAPWR